MCYFICLTVTGMTSTGVDKALARRGLPVRFEPLSNPCLDAVLAPGELCLVHVSPRGCDCGTGLGSARRQNGAGVPSAEQIAKLTRKGWSVTRIDRWIGEKTRAARRADARRQTGNDVPWAAVVTALLDAGAGTVGLLLHFYSGDVATEQLRVGRLSLPVADANDECLAAMPVDVVYTFGK